MKYPIDILLVIEWQTVSCLSEL